jgi:dodecin
MSAGVELRQSWKGRDKRRIEVPIRAVKDPRLKKEAPPMAKNQAEGVYRVIDVIGTSPTSWEDAAKTAVETASKSLRDLRIAEVTQMDLKIEDGKVLAYRARVQLSFKYEEA